MTQAAEDRGGAGAGRSDGSTRRGPVLGLLRIWLIASMMLSSLVACSPDEPPDGRRYTVSGVVRGIDRSEGTARLTLEHEAIPDFVDIDGRPTGMEAMTMTLTVWRGATVPESLQNGDAVRFVLDVDWERTPTALVVALEVLGESETGLESASEG